MNGSLLLLSHFSRLCDAPGAIPRLRKLILDLGVRGKLVSQDPNDESGFALLERIRSGNGDLYESQQNEIPFSVPRSWTWDRLGSRLKLVNGRAFKPSEWQSKGLPIVRIQNLNNADAPFNYCDEATVDPKHIIDSASFLISWSGTPGTSFGAFIWSRGQAALNQHIFSCFQRGEVFFDRFLQLAVNGRLDEMIARAHGGVGLQHITKGKLGDILLPIPPFTEQCRIVDKIDELMALCDRLESSQSDSERARYQTVIAALYEIDNGSTIEDCAHSTRFYLQQLPSLTTSHSHLKQLKQTILNLAMRGRLVRQDTDEEPVLDLLARVRTEQSHLPGKQGRRSRVNDQSSSVSQIPFDLAPGWKWTALSELITFGPQNGISPQPSLRADAPRAVTLSATTKGVFDPRYFKHVEANVPKDSELWLRPGDLLFQRGNTREYVGMAAYYDGIAEQFLYPDLMIKVRVSSVLDLQYIHLCTIAPYGRAYLSSEASGAQATMPKINQATLLRMPIPIPPVGEQKRIVARVTELMTICDQLESQLGVAQARRVDLLEAVLAQALNDDVDASSAALIDTIVSAV